MISTIRSCSNAGCSQLGKEVAYHQHVRLACRMAAPILLVCIFLVLLPASVSAAVLWDNGNIVTDPGGGFGGADLSRDIAGGPLGFSVYLIAGGPHFRLADEFVVGGPGWIVQQATVRAYLTSTGYPDPPVASPFTGIQLNIWDGVPGAMGSNIVASSSTLAGTDWTGAYRVSSTAAATDRQRPVYNISAGFPDVVLPPGTYWADYQLTGTSPTASTTAFNPQVMLLGGGAQVGTGRQLTSTGWVDLMFGTPEQPMSVPLIIEGMLVPEPTGVGMLLIGVFALFSRIRRC